MSNMSDLTRRRTGVPICLNKSSSPVRCVAKVKVLSGGSVVIFQGILDSSKVYTYRVGGAADEFVVGEQYVDFEHRWFEGYTCQSGVVDASVPVEEVAG